MQVSGLSNVKKRAEHEVLIYRDRSIDRHKDGQITGIIRIPRKVHCLKGYINCRAVWLIHDKQQQNDVVIHQLVMCSDDSADFRT
jgi:hypothetical protein